MRTTAITIAVLILLAVGYVLSYAPVYRLFLWEPGKTPLVYAPVDWLIDNTPLGEPLLRWAELWDMRGRMSYDGMIRSGADM